ncbi:class I SAM-dependent methyltransferase [Rhodoferax sp. UBA5149]|uniref:class I SAM-dependent methyltransferase n=1 Tax=Rhodoferax sp. UBA5149 TaxID=1947379 RepID=UPI0025DACAC6|nr:class I SAM-dependent methyltransferase [Rhodoferax sp. UBA5149]
MTPEEYDAWYDSPRGRWVGDVEFELLCHHLDTTPGKSLLDVGCGTGWFTRRLAAAGLDVTGLDIDADALGFARQRSDHDISYVEGDACRLPFPAQSFDQVISITALCFVDDWPRAMAEIVRVTRRRFVLGLLNRHSLLWLDKGRSGGKGAYQGAHWHTRKQLDEVLKDLPVEHIRFSTGIFLPSGTHLAQAVERTLPNSLPWGSFLVVSGDVSK